MELARSIKGKDEISAMRCTVHAADSAIAVMHSHLEPSISEQRLWSYLHAENIARGGEWIETRLLSSGPRCNPWYQECSGRIIQNGDLVGFDTDMIGHKQGGAGVKLENQVLITENGPEVLTLYPFESRLLSS